MRADCSHVWLAQRVRCTQTTRFAVIGLTSLSNSLDTAENFGALTDELRGMSHISRRIPRMLGGNRQRMNVFYHIPQSYVEQAQSDEHSPAEKPLRDQRVTVHYEKGQAPFLQIRFSTFDFPPQAVLTDGVQQIRTSLSGLIPARAGAGSRAQQHGENVSDERPKSVVVAAGSHHVPPDWIRPPERSHTRQGSRGTVSDNLSIVRDLERRFPNLPPRVTGKFRGSILGENYEEDPFPVVGVSRQSSLRQDNPSEEGGTSVALRSSGSIKRKPAPPLLENITYISDRRRRPVSTWGGFTQDTANYSGDSTVVPRSPSEGTTVYSPDPALAGVPTTPTTPTTPITPITPTIPTTPRSRKMTARNIIKRASRAMSDASIRSAEWLASANSSRSPRTPITAMDIELYRRGTMGPTPMSAEHESGRERHMGQ